MTEAETLREQNLRLQARIEELEAHSRTEDPPPPTRSPSPHETPPPLALKDVKIDLPPEFDGKPAEYAAFVGHCEFYFDNKPSMFLDNDKNKVSLVISRLHGHAATWAHSLRRANPNNPVLTSWPLFRAELDSLFEDTYYIEQMRREYHALKQKGSARNFATEFKTLATILNKDEGTKIFDFKEKLKSEVQKGLVIATGLTNFDVLVAKAIELDQTLFETAKAAKKAEQSQKSGPSSSSSSSRNPSSSSPGPRNSPSQNSPGRRPPLTAEEKNRRESLGLCRFCGNKGHFKKDCPDLKAKLERDQNKGSSRYPTPVSSSNVNVPPAPVTVSHIISAPPMGKFDPQGQ